MDFVARNILSLVDLSQATAGVLSWTRLLAAKLAAEVKVLHVMWPPVPRQVGEAEGEHLAEEFEERREELRRALRAQVSTLFRKDIHYDIAIGVGHPVRAVLSAIEQLAPELVVLGSHGDDGMARSLMGSVAENVVRESTRSTLVVKGMELPPDQQRLNTLLCPVDVSSSSAEALEAATSLARSLGASLEVLRVLPGQAGSQESEVTRLKKWIEPIVRQRCPTAATVHFGDTAEQIVLFARQHSADLVVLGTEPRRFLEFSVLGRTAERVVRHGPCSVLLLRLQENHQERAESTKRKPGRVAKEN